MQRTAERILDVAERLVQSRGYNGFSYADVAAELNVSKPSLHYHFSGKAELGEALVTRYATRFAAALQAIDEAGEDAPTRLNRYASLYADVLDQDRMCLCGMLAADDETLPRAMREAVMRFFDDNETWLARVLQDGVARGLLRYEGSAADEARLLLSALEGAMLVARPYRDPARFREAARRLLGSLSASAPPAPRAPRRSTPSPAQPEPHRRRRR
ncbi:MAG TPA: TetR/AcrR family transcriptional regulator [Candidatus Dormibacteraeota bacterium]|jgi:TetR/AcrR family transcriptional repressor of nem operon|nr:TetR/AcrR family transcriptional regulator [Candidatus Dormibacteraeota bacterium]